MISPKFRNSIYLILILSVVLVAFWPSLQNEFVFWDDDVHLYENISVRYLDIEHLGNIFTERVNKLYIPLTSLSFAVEYHFFGYDPFIYHLNNLILHSGIVAMIFWFGLRLGLSAPASTCAAILFGVHPMHVESVAWVTERKDVLYSFFYMASLLSYCRFLEFTRSTPSMQLKKKFRFLVLSGIFGVLSMLAKPMALSLPLILLLLDWFHGRKITRQAIIEKVPVALAIAAITWASYVAHARIPGKGVLEGLLIWPWTFVFYIKQFIFPFILVPVYTLPKPIFLASPEYAIAVIVLALIIFATVRFRKYPWFVFAVGYYFFSIFFLLRFDEAKDLNIVADRFMYLPSLGLCLLIGYGLQCAWGHKKHLMKIPVVGLSIIILIFLIVKTNQQTRIWNNSIALWTHQLKYFPNESVALNNLAAALREEDEYKIAEEFYRRTLKIQSKIDPEDLSAEAIINVKKVNYVIGLYAKAIESNPRFVDSHYNLGKMLAEIDRIPEAVASYKKALELDHKYKDVHFSLGELYSHVGDYKQAVYAFEQTIRLNPENEDVYVEVISAYNEVLEKEPQNTLCIQARKVAMDKFTNLINSRPSKPASYFNLGVLYGGMGDFKSALSAYEMVLDENPNHGNTLYNIGNIYRDQGRISDALNMYQKAVKTGSNRSDAYLNMGTIYQRQGKQELARVSFEKAIKLDSLNGRAYFNLGLVEERSGKLKTALDLYKKSIEIEPQNAKAYYNLGNTYARLRKNSDAITSYLSAVELEYDFMDAWINLSTLSFKEGDFTNAIKYCDKAILLGYNAPERYLNALAQYRVGSKSILDEPFD